MCSAIDNTTSCEFRAVTRFLNVKNTSVAEIYRELCAVYELNVMSEGTVGQWCRIFKDGRTNVHDEEGSGRPTTCSE
jgi:hypothetical protein